MGPVRNPHFLIFYEANRKIRNFLWGMPDLRGKFIVIDGTDGVGKTTQTALLARRLNREGYSVFTIEFPQYGKKSAALIEDYLAGKYGFADEVSPYTASIFYACDRFDAAWQIREALAAGHTVVANRYTASNLGHQGGKIRDPEERRKYWEWLLDLEFIKMKIPAPDLTLILDVSVEIGAELARKRNQRKFASQPQREDIHEISIEHLRQAANAYLEVASLWPNSFAVVQCVEADSIIAPTKAHDRIWSVLAQRF